MALGYTYADNLAQNANQGGLTFDSTGLLTSDSYSVTLTFEFLDRTDLKMLSGRSGLSMSPGSKVTFNGVQIGPGATLLTRIPLLPSNS